jgi:membrane protease subunit (stomatin/prohibitin family)
MFFPSGMNGMGRMAGVEMQMMQTVMNARRLRAAQQINELRMLQQATGNTSTATRSNSLPTLIKGSTVW